MIIKGNTVGTTTPRPDWNQNDPKKADYIKNKPMALSNFAWASDYATVLEAAMAMPKTGGTFFAIGGSTIFNAADSAFPGGEVTYLMLTDETSSAARRTIVAFHYGRRESPKYRSIWDRGWQMADWEYLSTAEGYGIGGNAKNISGQDLNTIVAGGFYYWNDTAINSPLGANCYMEVIPGSGHSLTQIVREMTSNIGCSIQRCKITWGTDEWSEWEWVNPPMIENTEYRTTERYMNKAVYAVLINFGALPNNASKNIETSFSAKRIVSVNTWFVDGETYSYSDSTLIKFYRAAVSNGHIRIDISTGDDMSATTGYFLVKYTKE